MLDQEDQVKVVQQLWRMAFRRMPDLKNANNSDLACWGTGDGFYAVMSRISEKDKLEFVDFGKKLLKDASKSFELRCALHFGDAHPIDLPDGRIEFSGTGLNEISRIIPFAREGQTIFSHDFVKPFENARSAPARKFALGLFPPVLQPAYTVSVKNAVRIAVRWDSSDISAKMTDVLLAVKHIELELEYLLRFMKTATNFESTKSKPTRISVFTPARDQSGRIAFLEPSNFRVSSPQINTQTSKTLYLMEPAQGIAKAWHKRSPIILAHLPDPSNDPQSYFLTIRRKFGLPKMSTEQWAHFQRSFISIPIVPYGAAAEKPIAVLCFDSADPLDHLSDEELKFIANSLEKESTTRLGPLLRLYFGA